MFVNDMTINLKDDQIRENDTVVHKVCYCAFKNLQAVPYFIWMIKCVLTASIIFCLNWPKAQGCRFVIWQSSSRPENKTRDGCDDDFISHECNSLTSL